MGKKYENNDNINGVINIYKERGYTSFDVVALVRKHLRCKCGHTGTLDPNAEGVLPVCLGKATKLVDYLTEKDKEYITEIKLGITTDTQDADGTVLETMAVPELSFDTIKSEIMCFLGEGFQLPPMYSAIKIGGKKLCDLARSGIEIEREKRPVNFKELEIMGFNGHDEIKIRVLCSKGTYIRTLANDIGEKLGCGAHMKSLLRTKSGMFELKNAIKIHDFAEFAKTGKLDGLILPMTKCLPFRRVYVRAASEKKLFNGNPLEFSDLAESINISEHLNEKFLVFTESGELYGIASSTENHGFRIQTTLYVGNRGIE